MGKWEMVKFSDIVFFQEGPGVRNWQFKNCGVKLINIKNIVNGNLELSNTDKYLSPDEVENKYKHFLLQKGDYVMASSGVTWGKIAEVKEHHLPLCLNTSIIRLRPLDDNTLERTYIKSFVNSYSFIKQINRIITGSAQPNFGPSHLKQIEIPLPPLEEQQRIAKNLDLASELVKLHKTELKELDKLIQSVFNDMFGDPVTNEKDWEVRRLSGNLNVIGGYAFKSTDFKETGIPVLKIGNINSGVFKKTNLVFWKDDKKLEKYAIYPNDLVITLTGTVGKEDYGNVCILDNTYQKYYLNQRNAKLEIKGGDLHKWFLMVLLKDKKIKSTLTGVSRGVRQANISNADILNLHTPLPPLPLQQKFANIVTKIEEQKAQVQTVLNDAEQLYNSLMQEYFE